MSRCDSRIDDTWRLPGARDDAFTNACVNVSHADVTSGGLVPQLGNLSPSFFVRAGDAVQGSLFHPARRESCSSARMASPQLERGLPFSPPAPHISSALLFVFSFLPPFVLPAFIYLSGLICVSLRLIASSPRGTRLSLTFHIFVISFHINFHFFLSSSFLSRSLIFQHLFPLTPARAHSRACINSPQQMTVQTTRA